MLGRHYKLFGLQQPGSIEDHCEAMEEFSEEDIWGGVNDAEAKHVRLQENGCNVVPVCRSIRAKEGNSNTSSRSVIIPRKDPCHEENRKSRMRYQSAPVNIPDWSQMVREQKKNENDWRRSRGTVFGNSDDNEDGDGRDFERIPPHELVARQLAQSEITSFSVYEGIGRTLKGRDLRQVRNAVLTRTGFIE